MQGLGLISGQGTRSHSSVQSCPTLCDPMNRSMPGFPVVQYLLEFCSNSCPLRQWCHPTISSSVVPFSSCLQSFPASGSFTMRVLHIRWPKYWSFRFSISPLNEYSGLISFRMNWLDLLAVQGTRKSSPTPQFKNINSLAISFLYSPILTSKHCYWKNHSLD